VQILEFILFSILSVTWTYGSAQISGTFGRSHGVLEVGSCWDPFTENDQTSGINWALCLGNNFGIAEWSFVEAVVALNRPRSKITILGIVRPSSKLASQSFGLTTSVKIRSDLSVGLFSMVRRYSLENIDGEFDIGFNIGLSVSDDLRFSVLNRGIWNKLGFIRGWNLLQMNYTVSERVKLYLAQFMSSTNGRTMIALQLENDHWDCAFSLRTRPFTSGFTIERPIKGLHIRAGFSYQLLPGVSPNFELYQG